MTVLGQQLISSVRAHAAENPHFVYHSPFGDGACVYIHNGCPSCLIGRALYDAGLIDASLEDREDNHVPVKKMIEDVLDVRLDPEERLWLRRVQNEQDFHTPWGEAVAQADAYVLGKSTPKSWDRLVA